LKVEKLINILAEEDNSHEALQVFHPCILRSRYQGRIESASVLLKNITMRENEEGTS
jgi:hypothetical protein